MDHWYEFLKGAEPYGATIIQETDITRIELDFTDGLTGDDDLNANGIIVDAGGPSRVTSAGSGNSSGGGGACFLNSLHDSQE